MVIKNTKATPSAASAIDIYFRNDLVLEKNTHLPRKAALSSLKN
jgi:hypothetical protein